MNISDIYLITDISNETFAVNSICEELKISLNYNSYIIFNFILSLFIIINQRFNLTHKIIDVDRINSVVFIVIAFLNVCMFLFQFLAYPIYEALI